MKDLEEKDDVPFHIAQEAAMQIRHVRELRGDGALRLRIEVIGGGCAGFQYRFSWDNQKPAHDDNIITHTLGVEMIVDATSLDFLQGATLEYKKEMIGSWFRIANPNAASHCGCGSSFGL